MRQDEVHFQPGTFLVRAWAIEPLIGDRRDEYTDDDEQEGERSAQPARRVRATEPGLQTVDLERSHANRQRTQHVGS